ncbi:hypothetical protein SDC9_178074 [bioreactor metagenome]|uniref:Uncharacterized protein n=1 Tax=bioreactor metagenome TaxID=1076179 RepID=A0A645H444_9ZZZZ
MQRVRTFSVAKPHHARLSGVPQLAFDAVVKFIRLDFVVGGGGAEQQLIIVPGVEIKKIEPFLLPPFFLPRNDVVVVILSVHGDGDAVLLEVSGAA